MASMLLCGGPADARTWWVKKDGTGDYTVIQDAVDASAVGDTIRIGPGRFEEYEPVTAPGGWTENIYVSVTVDSLTLIGAGADMTIIGPQVPTPKLGNNPRGIMVWSVLNAFWVRNIRLENNTHNLDAECHYLVVDSCSFAGGGTGIGASQDLGARVRYCAFMDLENNGFVSFWPARDVLIDKCRFENVFVAMTLVNTADAEVIDCTVIGGRGGVSIQQQSSAVVSGCRFLDCSHIGIWITGASLGQLYDNTVRGSAASLNVDDGSRVEGSGNIFGGGSFATMRLSAVTVDLHGSHIIHGGGYSVFLEYFYALPVVDLDLTGNYWGTTEADSISAWIWDHNDDPNIKGQVLYEPFATAPIGTKPKSWGELKALFR